MADEKLSQIVVRSTPRPLWIAAGVIIGGIAIALAFLAATKVIIFDWATKRFERTETLTFGLSPDVTTAITLAVGILVSLAIVLFIVRVVDDEKNDALTPLRQSLAGEWQVTASTPNERTEWHSTALFVIDPVFKKLVIEMRIPESPQYKELFVNVVEISLNPRSDPVTMTFFAQLDLVKRTQDEGESGTDVQMFFVRTKCLRASDKDRLEGSWHELTRSHVGAIKFERTMTR